MAKTKTKTLTKPRPVPQTHEEAAEAIKWVGVYQRQLARLEADLNDQISEIKKDAEEAAQPLKEKLEALKAGLETWASAHRDRLTEGGKVKSADLGTGKISWRARPPSVRISKVEQVLEALRTLGLHRFIRTKEEPNKEAMREEPEVLRLVPGVTIGSAGEDFIVEPFEVELSAGGA